MAAASVSIEKSDKRVIGSFPWQHDLVNVESVGRHVGDAMKTAGLDYTFHKEQVLLPDGRPLNSFAIVRDDNKEILSHYVGPEWTGLTNTERFKWFEPYLEQEEATILYAGQITDSQRTKIAVIARLDKNTNVEIQKDDVVAKYLLLSDAFGFASLRPAILVTRLICGNGAISSQKEGAFSIRHSKNISSNFSSVQRDITLWNENFENTVEVYKSLAKVDIKKQQNLTNYFMDVMNFKIKEGETELGTRQKNTISKLQDLFDDKAHNPGQNWFTGYNSITALANHVIGRSTRTSLNSLFYGSSNVLNRKALELAVEYAGKA